MQAAGDVSGSLTNMSLNFTLPYTVNYFKCNLTFFVFYNFGKRISLVSSDSITTIQLLERGENVLFKPKLRLQL